MNSGHVIPEVEITPLQVSALQHQALTLVMGLFIQSGDDGPYIATLGPLTYHQLCAIAAGERDATPSVVVTHANTGPGPNASPEWIERVKDESWVKRTLKRRGAGRA